MKDNPRNFAGEDGSSFDELIAVLIAGPDSCWTQSAKNLMTAHLQMIQREVKPSKRSREKESDGHNKRKRK